MTAFRCRCFSVPWTAVSPMSRTPLYFKRGYPSHGPGPYRRLLRKLYAERRENDALRAQVQALRELHRNHDDCPDGYAMCAGRGMCYACGKHWPCTTIRILDGGDDS